MRHDQVLLLDMLLAARDIREFTAGLSEEAFRANRMAQSAVIREFQVIGEAARQVSVETQEEYSTIAWRQISGMRNRMIHEYFDVRLDVVWDAIQNDIPDLIQALEKIVPPDNHDS
ncbi:MAG: DUF86 domain-containing protein [Anaerolineaceae bacterium]|nr:DUF86 domain-containing protein [Anaerolineaceae bacterium]